MQILVGFVEAMLMGDQWVYTSREGRGTVMNSTF